MAKEDISVQEPLKEERTADSALAKLAALRIELAALEAEVGTIPMGPDDLVSVTIDLAPYANTLQFGSRQFLHGQTYMVEQGLAGQIYEQMRRSWQHENTLVAPENPLRKKLNLRAG